MFNKKQFAHVFDITSFENLVVDLTGTDLVIRQAEQPEVIYYDEKNNHKRLEINQNSTTLKIKEKRCLSGLKNSLAFKFLIGKRRLEIKLPKKNFKKLTAIVTSGDIAISNVDIKDVDLSTGSGAVTIAYAKIEKFKLLTKDSNLVMKMTDIDKAAIESNTGAILFDQTNVLNNIMATISEGDLKMRNVEINDGLVTLGDGDVNINTFENTGDFKLTTDVGDISLRNIRTPSITIAAVRGNDLDNPDVIKGFPMHKQGTPGATFLTTAGHLDVYKDIEIINNPK